MDLTERPICFSSMPPAFMTGQACHIIHSDSVQQCPSWQVPALTQLARINTLISSPLIIYAQTHLLWHFINLNGLKLLSFKKLVFIHFTEGRNVCPSYKYHQTCYFGYIQNDS